MEHAMLAGRHPAPGAANATAKRSSPIENLERTYGGQLSALGRLTKVVEGLVGAELNDAKDSEMPCSAGSVFGRIEQLTGEFDQIGAAMHNLAARLERVLP